ncbi:MAG TPA: phage-shock protein [Desulfobacteraceae bacterium]|nr:phage-shock protein [Desulfobacteraceae bacterium]
MEGAFIVSIIFGGILLALAVIGSTILIAIKIIRGGASPGGQRSEAEEARMVQEIYRGIEVMEKRLEALETILLEPDGKERNDD